MSTATHLNHESNRQAANNDHPILANTAGLGYHNLLLVELLLSGADGFNSVDATRQDNPRFWCDRLSSFISHLKHRKFQINGYLRKLTLPDGQYTRRKCYYLTDRNAALQAINYLNDISQANHKPPVFNADQKALILKQFKRA